MDRATAGRDITRMPSPQHARILVIDGADALAERVRGVLETAGGYQVEVETEARTALHTAHEFQPDLVLLDVNLHDADSAKVAAEFRTDPQMRKTRILFLGTMNSPGMQGFRNGAYFLAKPVQPAALLRAIGSELVTPSV